MHKVFPAILFTLFSAFTIAQQVDVESRLIDSYTVAVPVERPQAKYPSRAAKKGVDGWVQLSYVIDQEGKVKDVVAMNNGGDPLFVKAAMSAVKTWQFEPATANGEPIEQCNNSVQMDFILSKGGRVGRKLYRSIRKGHKAINNKDIALAKEALSEIDEADSLNITELFWRNHLAVSLHNLTGDEKRKYHAARKARASLKTLALKDSKKQELLTYLLLQEFIYQSNNALYSSALDTFDKLKKASPEAAADVQSAVDKIKQRVAENEHILVAGKVSQSGRWSHNLARNSFVITDIEGRLDKLEVRCSRKFRSFTVSDQTQWKIPESWGKCNIHLLGQEQSKFNLVEINS